MMDNKNRSGAALYVHGKGGSAAEAEHFKPLFPLREVVGLDYKTFTPWETRTEIFQAVSELSDRYAGVILIANSVGAFFALNAGIDAFVSKAYFISPVVDIEKLILDMMSASDVSEEELKAKGVIKTAIGKELSWEYLRYIREHPVKWDVPTEILYGSGDRLVAYESVAAFAEKFGAKLTVMDGGEHWFHTDAQMRFLDEWLLNN